MILCTSMLFSMLAGCVGEDTPDTASAGTTASTPTGGTEAPTNPTEPPEPDDGSFKMYYDDRTPVSELGASENSVIEIKTQEVTSYVVGSKEYDANVLYYDEVNRQFIAVGTGTAVVSVDGVEQLVRVRPAPISLFMITGHSIGAGQCGNGAQSVVSEAGQAYSTHKTSTLQEATEDMGIGYLAASKPTGIDAFTPGGGGTIGEGSAIAWQWHQLTGEKAWVLNAAVGGSCINEWIKGESFYEKAVAMYRAAAQILKNEVAAGHYVLRNTAIIYHSAANFGYKNVEFTDEILEFWYHSMCDGFRADLAMDISGDGVNETVDAIGFAPIWSRSSVGSFEYDKPANYYMAASNAYPDIFIASDAIIRWLDDPATNFPAITYETQSEPVEKPEDVSSFYAEDNVHYMQVVYNAAGLDIGQNLYSYFRKSVNAESVTLMTPDGRTIGNQIDLKKKGSSIALVLVCDPCYVGDFTITVSDNLELKYPFVIKAKAAGTGSITISQGDTVLLKITVNVGE